MQRSRIPELILKWPSDKPLKIRAYIAMPQCYRDSGTIHTHAHTRQQTGNHPDVGYVAFILKALFADSGKQVDGVLTWILTILRFDPLPQIFFFFLKKVQV